MNRSHHTLLPCTLLSLALATALGLPEAAAKSPHKVKGSLELQFRTNSNISVAPGPGTGFDFADAGDFGADEDEEGDDEDGDEDEDDESDDDDFDGDFDDLEDADFDEDEIEEDDSFDEDGDGIDDLLDPNADVVVDKESRVSAKLGISHRYQFEAPAWRWTNGVRLVQDRHQDRSDLDKFNWALSTGLEYGPKKSPHQFRSGLSYVTVARNSNTFASTFVLSLGYRYTLSERVTLGAAYNYQDKDISDPNSPDARVDTLALTASMEISENDIVNLRYAPKVEDSTRVTRNTDATGWEIAYSRKLPLDLVLGVGFSSSTIEYTNLDPRREDDNDTWAVQLGREFSKQWSMEVGYETRERRSNIENKDAENDSYYLTASWKF